MLIERLLTELELLFINFAFITPYEVVNPQSDIFVKARILPIPDPFNPSMFDRIVMNVINMAFQIILITDQMLPITPLPDG
jgi:hypothetical protein